MATIAARGEAVSAAIACNDLQSQAGPDSKRSVRSVRGFGGPTFWKSRSGGWQSAPRPGAAELPRPLGANRGFRHHLVSRNDLVTMIPQRSVHEKRPCKGMAVRKLTQQR